MSDCTVVNPTKKVKKQDLPYISFLESTSLVQGIDVEVTELYSSLQPVLKKTKSKKNFEEQITDLVQSNHPSLLHQSNTFSEVLYDFHIDTKNTRAKNVSLKVSGSTLITAVFVTFIISFLNQSINIGWAFHFFSFLILSTIAIPGILTLLRSTNQNFKRSHWGWFLINSALSFFLITNLL